MMQVFLGDQVTLVKDIDETTPAYVTGKVSGILLDDRKTLERIWIHGFENSFWLSQGWKFIEELEEDDDELD